MTIDVSITNSVDANEWETLLVNSENATIFHTSEFIKTFPAYPNCNRQLRARFFVIVRNGTGQLIGGMPFVVEDRSTYNLSSLPFGCYGGAVIRNDSDKNLTKDIIKAFFKFGRKCVGTHVLNRLTVVDFFNTHNCLTSIGFQRKNAFAYILELKSSPEYVLMNKVDKKARSQIRQAVKKGLAIKKVDSPREIKVICNIIRDTAYRHCATPIPEKLVSEDILTTLKIMGKKKMAKYLIAYLGNEPLAYALQLMYKDFVFYASGGSYEKHWRLRPNHLLIWSIIEDGAKNRCKYLNFGSVHPEQHGLAKFKESWGARRVYYSIYEKGSLPLRIALFLRDCTRDLAKFRVRRL